ncbi:MAG TPA: ImmA/IrrE family metallo-endopeptidase [Pyrinomonadaceae bacterium]|nr:ImmA/IrrE family metallo-endopeptidase [Pyrinomonadaceae bacterium]
MKQLLLPPTEKRKQFELRALGLRDFAGVAGDQALDPFALAQFAKLMVVDFDQIEGLSLQSRAHLLGDAADEWSGGACSQPLPNGWRIVILNPAHGLHRNRATLMEEVAHVFLGHKANRLAAITDDTSPSPLGRGSRGRVTGDASSPLPQPLSQRRGAKEESSDATKQSHGRMLTRDYNAVDEEAAYAIGAAALVPYAALRRLVLEGRTADEIARRFRVSRQLTEYRIKVTHLWAEYKRASASRTQHV